MFQRRRPSPEEQPEFKITRAQDHARDVLISDAVHCALGGGSRSGKTFLLVRQVLIRAMKAPGSRHAIFRFRFNSIKSSIIYDTLPKVMKLCFPSLPPVDDMLNKTDWFMTLPNGSEIWFSGLDDKERVEKVLGNEYVTIYFNECSQIPWHSVSLTHSRLAQRVEYQDENDVTRVMKLKCFYDFNPPSKRHWTFILFIDKKNPEDKVPVLDPMNYAFYRLNPMDNEQNLAPGYIAVLEAMPERKRKRFLHGQFADDSDGQLWSEEVLAQNRELGQSGKPLPDFQRIVIGVDPSGASGPEEDVGKADDIGIIVGALGTNGHGYILEDLTLQDKPEVWGMVTAQAYERSSADRVVGESNFGGDMVRATIHAQNPNIAYKHVHASRGKVVRAEPISALYDQHKVHHVGHFPELEDELLAFLQSGYIGIGSPNRADALIWVLTELFEGIVKHESKGQWRPPKVKSPERSGARYDRRRM
jgi:hypothetical protein